MPLIFSRCLRVYLIVSSRNIELGISVKVLTYRVRGTEFSTISSTEIE